jgi:phosphoenolpyruvate synthase/pyruvate phosphate dikinase
MSVVVQEMVDARYAGVMFTLDPVHKKYNLIEAIEGLGEKLVSGQVTPNTYFLNRETGVIEDSNTVFELDQGLVKIVFGMGKEIEQHYKYPMDIEWAIGRDSNLYILQARHITTL